MIGKKVGLMALLMGCAVVGVVRADGPGSVVLQASDAGWLDALWWDVAAAVVCDDNGDCGSKFYCSKPVGDCDGLGQCARRPRICLDVWDPVCGCDGRTYSNTCYAARAGVSVDYYGECIPPPQCTDNSECAATQWCSKATGDCDGLGTCEVRPEICPTLWDPVCGCDGQTYSNECVAHANGVNVDYWGQCTGGGCTTNAECGYRQYCAKPRGHCNDVGQCALRPEICLDVWIPVCGCDGNTYSNDCYAARVGVNVAYEGYCNGPDPTDQ